MPDTAQEFLAAATKKAAAELITALESLPAEKRLWKPSETARSAMDVFAECAILNGITADTVVTRTPPSPEFLGEFGAMKTALAQNQDGARALLESNTERVIAAIRVVPSEDLEIEVPMPWGPQTVRSLCAYPFWNMTYHQGQIIYIASLLGK